MHRSGTSALARAIGLMGAGLGPAESLDHHWEQVDLWRFENDLLRVLGSEWDTPAVFPRGWTQLPRVRQLEPLAARLVESFAAEPAWVMKDPRLCLTLPFWREQVGLSPLVVFIYRNPLEVAASLDRRDRRKRLRGARALALWERYNCDGLANSRDLPRIVVSYDRLLSAPVETCERVREALSGWGVAGLKSAELGASELDTGQRHHRADGVGDDDGRQGHVTAAQARLLADLERLERGEVAAHGASPETSVAARAVLETWRQTRRLVRALREARGATRQLATLVPGAMRAGKRPPGDD